MTFKKIMKLLPTCRKFFNHMQKTHKLSVPRRCVGYYHFNFHKKYRFRMRFKTGPVGLEACTRRFPFNFI